VRLGLRSGVSDLFVAFPTGLYSGLFLELKRNKRYTPSEMKTPSWIAQQIFIDDMKSVGYEAKFCYGCEDGIRIIESYLLT
jgi:hypothetical protein